MIYFKDEDFEELIQEGIHLVDFYADWCGPCKMLEPVLEELDSINIIKVNIDEHNELATKYGVMSIPTLIFFKDKEEIAKEIGYRSKEEIEEIINNINTKEKE